jgi:hypothetical protein
MLWIKANKELPTKEEFPDVYQLPCLIVRNKQLELCYYNFEFDCWDDSEADGFLYNPYDIDKWCVIDDISLYINER